MSKSIRLPLGEREYILQFSAETCVTAEKHGFKISDEYLAQVFTAWPTLFWAALQLNHPTVNKNLSDNLFDKAKQEYDMSKIIQALIGFYAEEMNPNSEAGLETKIFTILD